MNQVITPPAPKNSASKGRKWRWFHRFGSPAWVYRFASNWAPRFGVVAGVLFLIGLYQGLVVAPPDYQMGDSYRIIFVHVPSAWLSMFSYFVMAVAAAIGLVWRMKVANITARSIAPLGALFTFCALVTGSLWGKPTWGTYWVWDARLTSELILLFLFIGFIALHDAFEDRRTAARASAILAIVGVVNLPIIHFSVEWWNTLHQGSTVTRLDGPTIDSRMLSPLLIMFLAFNFYFAAAVLNRLRVSLLDLERKTNWVKELVHG